jgi:flagellar motility protein MotE (MotC chaperone)
MLNVPMPRLLPTTMAVMATVLLLKCAVLLQGALTHGERPERVMVAVTAAAGAEHLQEPPKPAPAGPRPQPEAKAGSRPAAAQPAAEPPPVSDSERTLLQDLRQRRKELEAKADAIAARESVVAAAEQKLGERVTELQSLQSRLEGISAAQKQKEEAGWQGLVKVYEAMKPKDAATIFNELTMPVLLQVLDRMKDAKAAAVLAAMSPEKARDVTADLAQLRTGRDVPAGAVTKPDPRG